MNDKINILLLKRILMLKGQADITVTGISMHPTLYEGDNVTVKSQEEYQIGDILVFGYKNEGIIIHRLLKYEDRYFCKGDNAFRLEDIGYDDIIGRVIAVNGKALSDFPKWKIEASYKVNREFFKNGYDRVKTVETAIYKMYMDLILRKEEQKMQYKKTNEMDFIYSDETSLAVFDPNSGDTYFFDEVGIDIFGCIKEPIALEEILDKLCEMYDAEREEIRGDVEEFLAEAIAKGIVEIL